MMLRIDRDLHIVADNPSVLAARCHCASVGIGERDLPVFAAHHFRESGPPMAVTVGLSERRHAISESR
jgi:hypothetical protein